MSALRPIRRRWLVSSSAERQRYEQLSDACHEAELGEVKAAGIGHVSKRAMLETAQTNLIRQEAERLAPDAAELMAIIAVASAVKMAGVIDGMYSPGYRR